jgi:PAS domain-containing protein
VIAVNNEDRLIYVNPAAEAKYNVQASEILGSKLSSLFQTEWPNGSVRPNAGFDRNKWILAWRKCSCFERRHKVSTPNP